MSLVSNISNLATRIATEIKSVRTLVNGNAVDLSSLTTATKTNLVAALNELQAEINALASGSAGISDSTTATTTTWSSQKVSDQITASISALTTGAPTALDTLDELAAALGDDANFAGTITTALGNRVRFDAAQTLTGAQKTQAQENIGAADATTTATALAGKAATTHTHTTAQVTGLDTALSGKAPTSHTHTASQISDSTSVGRSVMTAVDAAAARTAIGAGTGTSNLALGTTSGTAYDAAVAIAALGTKVNSADIGATETDYVAIFTAALL